MKPLVCCQARLDFNNVLPHKWGSVYPYKIICNLGQVGVSSRYCAFKVVEWAAHQALSRSLTVLWKRKFKRLILWTGVEVEREFEFCDWRQINVILLPCTVLYVLYMSYSPDKGWRTVITLKIRCVIDLYMDEDCFYENNQVPSGSLVGYFSFPKQRKDSKWNFVPSLL